MIETIVRAAICWNGAVYSLPKPARHHNVIRLMTEYELPFEAVSPQNQGFLTSFGDFVYRDEACIIARKSKQIEEVKRTDPQDQLFSEDLW